MQVSSLTGIVSVSSGANDSLALKSDGTAWAWGYNGDGELGNGTTSDSYVPTPVSDPPEWGMSPGTLSFDIGGTTPCPCGQSCGPGFYSQLCVTGTVTLDGATVILNFIDGFTPQQAGNTIFHIISAAGQVIGTPLQVLQVVNGEITPYTGSVVFDQNATGTTLLNAIVTLQNQIRDLDVSVFKKRDITKTLLLTELDVVMATINEGIKHPKYSKFFFGVALAELQLVILPETNGCEKPRATRPDGDDLIVNCTAQGLVYPLVLNAIDVLRHLL